jgi:fructokinase
MQAIFEPRRIVFGGGVMGTQGLLQRVVDQAEKLGGGYFRTRASDIVTAPELGENAGLLGALAIAISSTSG